VPMFRSPLQDVAVRTAPKLDISGPLRRLTGDGVAPILPHRKNRNKLRKHKAF
jgi:hypothetical protein